MEKNVISGAGFAGIQVGFATAVTVSGATVSQNKVIGTVLAGGIGDGILVRRGADTNTIKKNKLIGNGRDGLRLAADSGGSNTVERNDSDLNTGFGYKDAGGASDVFTANKCNGNTSGGSDPAGTLCSPQT